MNLPDPPTWTAKGTTMTDTHDDDGFDPAYHRHAVLTLQLMLAELTEMAGNQAELPADDGAELAIDTNRDLIVAEVDDCSDCWRGIATRAVFWAAAYMQLNYGVHQAIAEVQHILAGTLDAGQP